MLRRLELGGGAAARADHAVIRRAFSFTALLVVVVACLAACTRGGFSARPRDAPGPDTTFDQFIQPDFGDANCTTDGWCFAAPPRLGMQLTAVWGAAPDDVYAVGRAGDVVHYDGKAWREVGAARVTNNDLNGLWGTSRSDVWAVGNFGTIVHFDGSDWSVVPQPGTLETLRAVWAAAPDAVFAVGDRGTVTRFDGNAWTASQPTQQRLNGVWGLSPSEVYAVGDSGVVLRFDGNAWQSLAQPSVLTLSDVHGTTSNNIIIAACGGSTLLHYDGATFTTLSSNVTSPLTSLWVIGDAEAYAVGLAGTVVRYDGKRWSPQDSGSSSALLAIWGAASGTLQVVGSDSAFLARR
ncbi:MAG: hypothetical protein KC503_40730 [Myxococcales bacterium]|nr:hypothetical protein [Myxococcales bacterium]